MSMSGPGGPCSGRSFAALRMTEGYSPAVRILLALLLFLGLAASAHAYHLRIGARTLAPTAARCRSRISLGNWLMPGLHVQVEVAKSRANLLRLRRLLGPERAQAFWRQFRDTYITGDDIAFIKRVGFNTVRIPLHYRLFMDANGEITGEGWFLLDRVLGWVREAGLFAILDLHAAPGGQTGINHDDGPGYPLMFYVPRDRQLTVKLWQAIARRYAGNPAILGYDILNEPIAPYHDVSTLNPRLEPFYKK